MGKDKTYSSDRSNKFIIKGKEYNFCKDNTTDNFRDFISINAEKIAEMQKEGMLNVILVSKRKNDVRNPKKTSSGEYWVSGDFGTYTKRMLVSRIINHLGLDYVIETRE